MSKYTKNRFGGFAPPPVVIVNDDNGCPEDPACPVPNRWVKIDAGGKSYLQQIDNCGNLVGKACALGTCSVDENGAPFPFDDAGNQIITLSDSFGAVTKNAGNTATISFPDGSSCVVLTGETITTMVANPDGSITYTNESGAQTVIPPATVSQVTVSGGVITHVAGDGTMTPIDVCALVAANCNATMSVNPDGSFTHTDNSGNTTVIPAGGNSSFSSDALAGTITHTAGNGATTTVNVCDLTRNCAPSIIPGPNQFQYTFNDGYGNTQIIDVNEIDMDINQMSVNGSVLNWTTEDGMSGSMDICAIVAANCNSPMTVNADGSITYVDNAGNTTIIPASAGETVTTFVMNADGSYTYTNEAGAVTTIPSGAVSTMTEVGGIITHMDGNGSTVNIDVCNIIRQNCSDSLTVNPDGSITHVAVDGTIVNIPASVGETVTTLTVNADGSLTYVSEDGTTTNVPAPVVSAMSAAGSVITHTAGDGTITNIDVCAMVQANCSDSMTINPDGSITHVALDGTVTNIPASVGETVTTLTLNPDGSLVYVSEDGTTTNVPAPVVSQLAESGGVLTHTAGDGTVTNVDLCAVIAANCSDSMVVNADGSVTHVALDGSITTIPPSTGETVTTLVLNADGSATYTSEDGSTTVLPPPVELQDKAGNTLTGTVPIMVLSDFAAGAYANTDRFLAQDAAGACKSVQIPQALQKDGTPIDTNFTPIHIDALTDAARPVSGAVGDKIIGQTADGSCVQFDPKKLVNGDGVELVDNQGPNGDACCVQEPLKEKCTGLYLAKDAELYTEQVCVKQTSCALGPDWTFNEALTPGVFDSSLEAEAEVLLEGYQLSWTNTCKCPVHIWVRHQMAHLELGVAAAIFYGKAEVSKDGGTTWVPQYNGSGCTNAHWGFTERSGLIQYNEIKFDELVDCQIVQPGDTYEIAGRLATRLRAPYSANWQVRAAPWAGLYMQGFTADQIKQG